MEFTQLKYFSEVARLENMTQAAELLHISQPSLSNSIARLEQDVGQRLFDRSDGRRLKLHNYGRVFYRRVERAMTELTDGIREIRELSQGEDLTVNISSSIDDLLSPLLDDYLELYPSDIIRQFHQNPVDAVESLYRKDVDIAISWGEISAFDVEWLPLFEDEIFLLVADSHWLSGYKTVDLSELAAERFIINNATYGLQAAVEAMCQKAGFVPRIVYEGKDSHTVGNLVAQNRGVSLITTHSCYFTTQLMKAPLKYIRISHPAFKQAVGIARLKEHYLTAAANRFYAYAIDRLKAFGAEFYVLD
jgi:DNA-binding transcriptional LysR family regulator